MIDEQQYAIHGAIMPMLTRVYDMAVSMTMPRRSLSSSSLVPISIK